MKNTLGHTIAKEDRPFCTTGTVVVSHRGTSVQLELPSGAVEFYAHSRGGAPKVVLPCAITGQGRTYATAKADFWAQWKQFSKRTFGQSLYLEPRRFMGERNY